MPMPVIKRRPPLRPPLPSTISHKKKTNMASLSSSIKKGNGNLNNETTKMTSTAGPSIAKRKRLFPFNPKKFAFRFKPKRRKGRQGKKTILMTSCPRETTRYIHPGYRHLIPWCKRFCGIVVRRNEATRIRNRLLYYFPFPRVFPYFCDNCQTSTPSLEIIQNHNCVRRRPRDFDPENEQKIIALGYRSRAKDRLAVMERLPNPQHYQVVTYHFHTDDDPLMKVHEVPTLSELCIEQSQKWASSEGNNISDVPVEEKTMSEHCMCLTCGLEFLTAPEYFQHLAVELECFENRRNPLLLSQC